MRETFKFLAIVLLAFIFWSCGENVEPSQEPEGADESMKTEVLEQGADILQTTAPLDPIDVYLVGFHPSKKDPTHQMEAHHFCNQVNEDFAQCVLFDGNTEGANLNGVEYIISEKLFKTLPKEERQYWHPHNYEILSGQLIAPGLPDVASEELMKGKMNSYGKTWHFWKTGVYDQPGDDLPLGEPDLAWSFNRDGEALPGLVEQRDSSMNVSTQEVRENRQEFVDMANPQSGVNALKGKFPGSTSSIPGVVAQSEQDSIKQDTSRQEN